MLQCLGILTYKICIFSIHTDRFANQQIFLSSLKCCGIGSRSHHSKLLQAMDSPAVKDIIRADTASLLHRVFKVESPFRKLSSFFLGRYISEGATAPKTLIHRVVMSGDSPVDIVFHKATRLMQLGSTNNGVIDSLILGNPWKLC